MNFPKYYFFKQARLFFLLENVFIAIIFNVTRGFFLQTSRHDEFSKILILNRQGYFFIRKPTYTL